MKTIDKIRKRAVERMMRRIDKKKVAIMVLQENDFNRRTIAELKALMNQPILMEKETIHNYPSAHRGIGYTKTICTAAVFQDVVIMIPEYGYKEYLLDVLLDTAAELATPENPYEHFMLWFERQIETIVFNVKFWRLNQRLKHYRLTKKLKNA